MPLSFPSNPSVGQQSLQDNGRLYQWSGYVWELVANVATHEHAASDITSGTLSESRLSHVPLHPFLLMGG
jgi:hypothetical protein